MLERVGFPWSILAITIALLLVATHARHGSELQAVVLRDGFAVVRGDRMLDRELHSVVLRDDYG